MQLKKYHNYIYYLFALLFSLNFLLLANYLDLQNFSKYLLVITFSSLFSAIFYHATLKSKKIKKNINVNYSNSSVFIIFFFLIFSCFYLYSRLGIELVFFFILSILFELILSILNIFFIKNNKLLEHSIFQFFINLIKNFFIIILYFYTRDLLIIITFYYLFFYISYFLFLKKINISFSTQKIKFKSIDILYVVSGALIFQLDKVFGEFFLQKDQFINYILIFKIASIFQILGSIIFQPLRNIMIFKEDLNKKNIQKIFFRCLYLLLILFILLLLFIFFSKFSFFEKYLFKINFINILIFLFISLGFIQHVFNGFFLDLLLIKNLSHISLIINLIIVSAMTLVFFKTQSILFWSITFFSSQFIITILSKFYYDKYVK
jgi:hypothetical protein